MAFEFVRGYVQLASGLGEVTKARALEAAQGLLALPGADEVGRAAHQASVLADQLFEAAKANRAGLVALVRTEVEAALARADVARHADLDKARARLTALSHEVDELRHALLAEASRTPLARGLGMSQAALATRARPRTPDTELSVPPSRAGAAPVRKTAAGKTATKAGSAPSPAGKTAAGKTATKAGSAPSPAGKTAAGKTAAKRTAAGKTAAGKTAAKRTAAGKTAAGKTAAKRTAAGKTAAKGTAAKRTAVKKTGAASPARKTAATTPAAQQAAGASSAAERPAATPPSAPGMDNA